MSEKDKKVTRSRKRSVSFSEEITIIGYSEPEIDGENERKILEKIDRPKKIEPKTLYEHIDGGDSNLEDVASPKSFFINLGRNQVL